MNRILRERAADFEVALNQTIDSSYHRCRHAMSVLQDLCRLLGELRHQQDVFPQAFDDFHRELVHSNLTGQLRSLPRLGGELVHILCCYFDREDGELHSVIFKEFEDDDLWEPRANA